MNNRGEQQWWETRAYAFALIALAALPLVWPTIPPLADVLGHLGRYRVQLDIDHSETLQQYYTFNWEIIGNLGVDLLIIPLSKFLGLELAVKLIVLLIPVLTVAGMLAVAKQVHGTLPATAAFALPLAYGFPFQYGFINFALSMALALLAFALWLKLTRENRIALRAAIFVPISLIIWVTHSFGWGFLGLICAASITAYRLEDGRRAVRALWDAALACIPLLPPLILMLVWRQGSAGVMAGDWFNLPVKLLWVASILRTEWLWLDVISMAMLIAFPIVARNHKTLSLARPLTLAAWFCLAIFLLLPRILFQSAYADMRLAPYMVALAVLAINTARIDRRAMKMLAVGALIFCVFRIGMTTIVFAQHSRDIDHQLAALDSIPRGARVVSLISVPCASDWALPHRAHLPGVALARREVFSNDQWIIEGSNLMQTHFAAGAPFNADPSQMIYPRNCRKPNDLGRVDKVRQPFADGCEVQETCEG